MITAQKQLIIGLCKRLYSTRQLLIEMNKPNESVGKFLQIGAGHAVASDTCEGVSGFACCANETETAPAQAAPKANTSPLTTEGCCGGGCGSTPLTKYLQIDRSARASGASDGNAVASETPQKTSEKAFALCLSAVFGAVLALSAPGFEQSYIAWVGLIPFLFATFTSRTVLQAFNRAFAFGAAYTLTYGHWLLSLNPAWSWISPDYIGLTAAFWWIVCALHQGTVFGVIAVILRKLPMSSGWFPEFEKGIKIPIIVAFPLLWVLMLNKVANCPATLGFPWTMLEYSQYRNLELIQAAKFVGGIGIGALIVLVNTVLFSTIINLFPRTSHGITSMRSPFAAIMSLSWVVLIVLGLLRYGQTSLHETALHSPRTLPVTLLQGNLSGKADGARPVDIMSRYLSLASQAPPGLCVWTEWVLPINLARPSDDTIKGLLTLAQMQKQSWLLGALEKDKLGNTYNAVCGMTDGCEMAKPVYRKRFLVPFLEHLPEWVSKSPLRSLVSTLAPGEVDLQPGTSPNVMNIAEANIGSLICLEVVQPELVNDSVRDGAEVLVDLSNTSWYDSPLPGRQMIAFSVLRAVETSRAVLFSTTVGPSSIIHPNGKIIAETKPRTTAIVNKRVPLNSEITPFVRWFR